MIRFEFTCLTPFQHVSIESDDKGEFIACFDDNAQEIDMDELSPRDRRGIMNKVYEEVDKGFMEEASDNWQREFYVIYEQA